ncbi:MAG TPA: hypothetical protein VLC46_20185 [Thermoanaerobaculia bacterium]|jgi:hypothetical protein|nr:hypothetical protein [Thermoanaerobaculia bacterium]
MSPRQRAVVTTPDLTHPSPRLSTPNPYVPNKIADATISLAGGAADDLTQVPFAFGLVETEGSIRYAFQSPFSGALWIARALALGEREATIYGGEQAGECDGLVGVYTDAGLFSNGNFQCWWHSGSLSQGIDTNMAAGDYVSPWDETLVITDKTGKRRAICYVIECWSNVAAAWASGIAKVRYRFRGSRVLNTTTGLVAYTTNPWWQGRYVALDPAGLLLKPSRINEASFQLAAANSPSGLYESNMLLTGSNTRDCRKQFGLLGAGWLVYSGGNQLTAIADRSTDPVVATYDDTNFSTAKPIEVGPTADPDQMVNNVSIQSTDTTDSSGVWKLVTVSLKTAGLLAGTEEEVPATFQFPQIQQLAVVQQMLGYLLYSYQELRIKGNWLANAGGPRLAGDVVTQSLPAMGISDNFRVMVRDKQPNGTFDVELALIDARKWAGASSTPPTRLRSTLQDPFAVPPTPPAPTVTQEVDKIKIVVNPPSPTYQWYGGQLVTVQQAGFAERTLGVAGATPLYIEDIQMNSLYTIRTRVINVVNTALLSLAATWTITPVVAQVEPPGIVYQSSDGLGVWWDPPQTRDAINYGASAWSVQGTAHSVWDPTKINDGDLTVSALVWNGAGSAGAVTVDQGSALIAREIEITWLDATHHPQLGPVYSSDNITLNPVSMLGTGPSTFGQAYPAVKGVQWDSLDGLKTVFFIPPSIGAYRFVGVAFLGSHDTGRIAEIRVRKYTGSAYAFTKGFRLFGTEPGSSTLVGGATPTTRTFDINFQPTNTNYIKLSDWFYSWNWSDTLSNTSSIGFIATLRIQTIATDDTLSDQRGYAASFVQAVSAGGPVSVPSMDGVAVVGTSPILAREDHVHPSDTSKADVTYVDTQIAAAVAGIKWKTSVRVATTAAGTLASSFANGSTIDGVTLATGDRILIKDQVSGSDNGIYTVSASGAPTRATDANTGAELVSAAAFAQSGTVNADRAFYCTNDSITLGSTSIAWVPFASVIGALLSSNNLSDIASPSAARTNLGLGTMATQNGTAPVDVSLSTQAASIGTTNLVASTPSAGLYRISWAQLITQAATTSSSLLTTIGWNNGSAKSTTVNWLNGAAPKAQADGNSAVGGEESGSIVVFCANGTALTYATTYASSGATPMQYSLRIHVERLSP